MRKQLRWRDIRGSYNKVNGKKVSIGQEATAGARKRDGWIFIIPKLIAEPGFLLLFSNLEILQSRNGHATKGGLKFYMNPRTALEIELMKWSTNPSNLS